MQKKPKLTARQKKFVQFYNGNATDAARRAGYAQSSVKQIGHENMTKPEIVEAIRLRERKKTLREIASREDRQEFWTGIMLDPAESIANRLKASELLGKSNCDFTEKRINEITGELDVNSMDVMGKRLTEALKKSKDSKGLAAIRTVKGLDTIEDQRLAASKAAEDLRLEKQAEQDKKNIEYQKQIDGIVKGNTGDTVSVEPATATMTAAQTQEKIQEKASVHGTSQAGPGDQVSDVMPIVTFQDMDAENAVVENEETESAVETA